MLIGMAGLVIPVLPGAVIPFLWFVTAALAHGFTHVGAGTLTMSGIMALLSYAFDFPAGAFGANRFGSSRRVVTGAAHGESAGFFWDSRCVFRPLFWGRYRRAFYTIGSADCRACQGRCNIGFDFGNCGKTCAGLRNARHFFGDAFF